MFNLESSLKAYEQARLLLADGKNDRATWIEAGRSLGHAQVLADDVTIDAHQRVLEFNRLKYRSFFHQLLALKPGSFFYGVQEMPDSIDEAARASTAPEQRSGRPVTSTVHELSEGAIYAVWEAAQWPTDYKDPVDKKFTEAECGKLLLLFPGLHRFFEHKHQWHSASGVLYPSRKK